MPTDTELLRSLKERLGLSNDTDGALRQALTKLAMVKLDMPEHFTENYGYEPGDEDSPFMTEAFLYVLLGKEDARTVLALFHHVCDAAGYDMRDLMRDADAD